MYQRYAVYFTPNAELGRKGAHWLGWDILRGVSQPHPLVDGLDLPALTATPRRYGLHGTIKAPFHLAHEKTELDLRKTFESVCQRTSPVTLDGLHVVKMGGFVALTPIGDQTELAALAATAVKELDPFRAPPSAEELARRRRAQLTPAQERNLEVWGYPYVMDQFRFHITLTGRIRGEIAPVICAIRSHFEPCIEKPFEVNSLTLAGQDESGYFTAIMQCPLGTSMD